MLHLVLQLGPCRCGCGKERPDARFAVRVDEAQLVQQMHDHRAVPV